MTVDGRTVATHPSAHLAGVSSYDTELQLAFALVTSLAMGDFGPEQSRHPLAALKVCEARVGNK